MMSRLSPMRTFARLVLALAALFLHTRIGPAQAQELAVQPVAVGLEHFWAVAFLPGGRFLVTERPGRDRIELSGGKALPA